MIFKSEDHEHATIKIHVPRNMDPRSMFRDLGSKIRFSSTAFRFPRNPRKSSSAAFRFPRNPRQSSSTAFRFLQRLSALFDAFLNSVTIFKFSIFLNGFPIFLNGFPLSEKSGKNLSTAANIQKIAIQASYFPLKIAIFHDKIISGWNTNNHYSFVFSAPSSVNLAN